MSQTACLVLGLAWALSAVAEPAYLRLEGVAADSEWIGWNEQGAYHLELPAEWELTAESGRRVVIRLAEGRTVELPEDTSLSAVGVARPTVQAGFVRGRHRGRGVTLSVRSRRLSFPGGAPFRAELAEFGTTGQALVSALELSEPLEIELFARNHQGSFERLQWQSARGEGAAVESVRLPLPAGAAAPGRVESCGFWSPGRVEVDAASDALTISAESPGWCEVNGVGVRPQAVGLQAPRAQLSIRQATFRQRARVSLPCRLVEPSGLMAERILVSAEGAPGVVRFAAADSAAALEQWLERLDGARAGSGQAGDDRLAGLIRDYLVPLWFGLWYDSNLATETVREPPSLARFRQAYAAAVAASRPQLVAKLAPLASNPGLSLAQPQAMATALAELVDSLAVHEPRTAVWWSVYLSDLLSTVARAPVCYWRSDQRLEGSVGQAAEVTMAALHKAAAARTTGLQRELQAAEERAGAVDEVEVARLAPRSTLPLGLMVEAGRATPVGVYQAEVRLRGAGESRIPLTIRVTPSYGSIALLVLAIVLPLGLVALLLRRLGRLAMKRGRTEHA